MATNYPGSSIQADTMQTLYLMNPSYTGYPDSSASGNMALTNNATGHALGNNNMSGNEQFQTHLIGVTLPTAVSLSSSASPLADTPLLNQSAPSSFLGSRVGDHTFSSWRDGGNEVTFLQPTDSLSNGQSVCALVNNSVHMGHRSIPETPQLPLRQQGVFPNDLALHPEQRHHSNGHNHGQCLSLSLSPQQASTVHLLLFQNQTIESDIHHTNISLATSEENRTMDDKGTEKWAGNVGSFQSSPTEEIFGNQLPNTVHRHGPAKQVQPGFNPAGALGVPKILIRSKYLKAAQQLLDEVVNVGKGMKLNSARDFANKEHNTKTSEKDCAAAATAGICLDCGSDLMSAERQELQMKKKKLVTMLDEVDRRYREYYHQMQIIVSSFEAAVSFGAAKTYTALALQTISRHFRCLRDAITGQIHLTNKSLGEEDLTNGKCEISRLHFADQQLRQQKALQQLGMMQHHAWRPQRGLPEHSVSVLRAWLFEHFLHPYPKDTDKHMLAQQTGLTRGQVSNWFINARVRLWKPMVEEMYLDETRESDMDSNASAAKISEVNGENKVPIESKQGAGNSDGQEQKHIRSMEERSCEQQNDLNDRNGTSWMIIVPDSRVLKEDQKQGVTRHGLSKESRSETQDSPSLLSPRTSMDADLRSEDTQSEDICDDSKYSSERPDAEDCNIFHYTMVNRNPNNNEALGSFQIGTLSRYDPDSFATRFSKSGDVSLTLGLQHCNGFSMSGTEQSYIFSQGLVKGQKQDLDNTSEDYNHSNDTPAIHATNPNESLNPQNRKSLPTHLLHDFVA